MVLSSLARQTGDACGAGLRPSPPNRVTVPVARDRAFSSPRPSLIAAAPLFLPFSLARLSRRDTTALAPCAHTSVAPNTRARASTLSLRVRPGGVWSRATVRRQAARHAVRSRLSLARREHARRAALPRLRVLEQGKVQKTKEKGGQMTNVLRAVVVSSRRVSFSHPPPRG